jgi:hypothetical protein
MKLKLALVATAIVTTYLGAGLLIYDPPPHSVPASVQQPLGDDFLLADLNVLKGEPHPSDDLHCPHPKTLPEMLAPCDMGN